MVIIAYAEATPDTAAAAAHALTPSGLVDALQYKKAGAPYALVFPATKYVDANRWLRGVVRLCVIAAPQRCELHGLVGADPPWWLMYALEWHNVLSGALCLFAR